LEKELILKLVFLKKLALNTAHSCILLAGILMAVSVESNPVNLSPLLLERVGGGE